MVQTLNVASLPKSRVNIVIISSQAATQKYIDTVGSLPAALL